ncbi:MAG TPA: hypothetical protein VGM80_11695 [Gaiellaceae bacterium]
MTSVSATRPATHPQRRTFLDRLIAAFPAILFVVAVACLYLVEASSRKTPWLFTDEMEWTQISRSIAATGHSARRTEPIYFKSVYAYLIAPFWWWFKATPSAYTAIKYANAVMMPLAAIPTYLLARMLVTKRSAAFVAAGSIVIPAMAYVTSIVPEVIAYPYYALASWLAVRAFKSGKRLDIVLAVAAVLGGYLIRQREFSSLPVSFVLAAGGLWLTGPRGRAWRRNWTRGDTIGAVVLGFGAFYLFNRIALQHVHEWQSVTQYYKTRMLDDGLRAGLSLAIGLGLLPVIGGLVALRLPERRGDPTYRAFAAWSGANIIALSIYTAVKATYIQNTFSTLWEERNMIYLSPLLLLGTAMVFEAKRLDRVMVALSTGLVFLMVIFKPIQTGLSYYEAPGSVIPALLFHYEGWSNDRIRLALVALLALMLVLLAARARRFAVAFAAVFLFAWMLSGEIAMTVGFDHTADRAYSAVSTPPNWIDIATGGQPVTVLGQQINADAFLETEFWNRTIDHVYDLDGTAPGPGPYATESLNGTTGIIHGFQDYQYVLAVNGVELDATPIGSGSCNGSTCALQLYRKHGPWRLAYNTQDQYDDGWCGTDCQYNYYSPGQKGTLVIGVSRTAYKGGVGGAPAGKVTIRIGAIALDQNHNPQLGRIFTVEHIVIQNGTEQTLRIPVSQTPVRVEVSIANPIPPEGTEARTLGAQLSFAFTRDH